jgi:hypothetical protein
VVFRCNELHFSFVSSLETCTYLMTKVEIISLLFVFYFYKLLSCSHLLTTYNCFKLTFNVRNTCICQLLWRIIYLFLPDTTNNFVVKGRMLHPAIQMSVSLCLCLYGCLAAITVFHVAQANFHCSFIPCQPFNTSSFQYMLP